MRYQPPLRMEGLRIPFRDPHETCCTGEGEGKDQGIINYWASGSSPNRPFIDFVVIPIFIHPIVIQAALGPHETCMQATGDSTR